MKFLQIFLIKKKIEKINISKIMVNWAPLILFLLLVLIFGMLGGLITSKKIQSWYKYLLKPKLNPPNWIFGPVWTVLYLLIGLSGYFVYSEDEYGFTNGKVAAFVCYFVQLILNYCWTPLFFGLNWMFIAGIEIVLLDVMIILNIFYFFQINSAAGYLLIPYLMWVSFACYLNWGLWYLNRKNKI